MPVVITNTFVAGTAMVAADVETNLDDVRTDWLNGDVEATDLGLQVIEAQHIYGRDFLGFPMDGAGGAFGDQWMRLSRRDNGEVIDQQHRVDLFVECLFGNYRTPIPGLGWTGWLKADSLVEVCMWAEAFEIHDAAGDGAAAGYVSVGQLECWLHNRTAGTYTEFAGGRIPLNTDPWLASVGGGTYPNTNRRVRSAAVFSMSGLASGIYDIFWAYNHTGAAATLRQLIVGHRAMTIEHHHD